MAQDRKHPLGLSFGIVSQTCGACAWVKLAGPGPKVLRCIAGSNRRVQADWQACTNWEQKLDCLSCAACCGPAYDTVEVSSRDPVRHLHPEWIEKHDKRFQVKRRSDNYCAALLKNNHCQIYADRPRCCRDFEVASHNCLFARRRLGFTKVWR